MSDFIIGLTGGIGSGKTTVANMFAELTIDIIDADIIARDVVKKGSPALHEIRTFFGDDFIQEDGELDRALLRQRIFSHDEDKTWLNELLHPLIRQNIISQAKQSHSLYCIIVAPLLIENNLTALVDRVLVIDVSESTQIERTTCRDSNSVRQVQAIISSQVSRANRLEQAHDIINNDKATLAELRKAVKALHESYLSHAEQNLIDN